MKRRASRAIILILTACIAGGAICWYGPWGMPFRYAHTDLVSLSRIAKSQPDNFLARREIGLRLAKDGDLLAEKYLGEAFALNSADPAVDAALGDLLTVSKRYSEAFQVLKAGVEHGPRYIPVRMAMGRLYLRKGSHLHAAEQFEASVKENPKLAEAHYELAICYLQTQQSAKAKSSIDRALELKPRQAHYLALKAGIDAATGNVDSGLKAAKEAAALSPNDMKIQVNQINLLLEYQRGPDDLRQADAAVHSLEKLDPGYPLLSFLRGELARLRKDWPSAVTYLERATRDAPEYDAAYFSLSQAYRRSNRVADADRALRIYKERQGLRSQLEQTRIAVGANPNDPRLHARIADIQLQLGNRRAAASSLRAALRIDPAASWAKKKLDLLERPESVATKAAP